MKRIDVIYDGRPYTIAGQSLDDIKARILEAYTTSRPFWLTVNVGSGSYQESDLLIAAGVPISVTGITEE